MSLFINTNNSALNAQRQLGQTTGSLGTSFERLSSGLRINGAKDDAAYQFQHVLQHKSMD